MGRAAARAFTGPLRAQAAGARTLREVAPGCAVVSTALGSGGAPAVRIDYIAAMTTAESKLIDGRTGAWEIVLGLEVHAQVASKSKLFSGAAVGFGAGPNEQVSLVDAAMPGMLPVINRHCVEQAVRSGLGLKAKINTWSRF